MKTENPQLENTMSSNTRVRSFMYRLTQLKPTRLVIFTTVFLFCLFISLSVIFLQPAIYQSYATLLTVAKTAIDQVSREADIEHVTIQKQVLLGPELLTATADRLKKGSDTEAGVELTPSAIRDMLDVRPIADTNLIEMVAEGDNPALLPLLINTWIDVYLDARAQETAQSKGSTIAMMQDELSTLAKKIELKRFELDQFRQQNAIISAEQQDNEAPARLKGLTDSLNKASEEEVKAKARLDAIRKSIERGQTVVPSEDTRTLGSLEKRAQELREQLEELDRQYTREYMALSPDLKVIPEKLEELENKIQHIRHKGQSVVVSEAEQEYAAARQATRSIREQLDQHRKKAAEFTARFTEHNALKSDLEELEQLYRDTQARLAQVEAQHTGKYPYVDVIERAFLPHNPIRPDYLWNAMIATIVSLLLGLAAIWIFEFLMHKEQEKVAIHLSGIHLHNQDNLNLPHDPLSVLPSTPVNLPEKSVQVLEHTRISELTPQQITALFQSADLKEKQLLIFLLNGLTLSEITALQHNDVDLEGNSLTIRNINTSNSRTIPLHPILAELYSKHGYCLIDPTGKRLSQEDLEALLSCIQIDAGLSAIQPISARILRNTYILYLVKQGIRLSDLEAITGYISPTELSDYGIYAPPGIKQPLDMINLFYPIAPDISPDHEMISNDVS